MGNQELSEGCFTSKGPWSCFSAPYHQPLYQSQQLCSPPPAVLVATALGSHMEEQCLMPDNKPYGLEEWGEYSVAIPYHAGMTSSHVIFVSGSGIT